MKKAIFWGVLVTLCVVLLVVALVGRERRNTELLRRGAVIQEQPTEIVGPFAGRTRSRDDCIARFSWYMDYPRPGAVLYAKINNVSFIVRGLGGKEISGVSAWLVDEETNRHYSGRWEGEKLNFFVPKDVECNKLVTLSLVLDSLKMQGSGLELWRYSSQSQSMECIGRFSYLPPP